MASKTSKTLEFNRPTFVGLLFVLGALSAGLFSLLGLLLAFAWSTSSTPSWQVSHYVFLMRGFWIALIVNIGAALLAWIGLWPFGAAIAALVGLWSLMRAVVSVSNALRREPMPEPLTYTF